MDQDTTTQPAPDENDTEGQAFKWQIVDDPKSGKRLRQGWTPDEPQSGRTRTATPTTGKGSNAR